MSLVNRRVSDLQGMRLGPNAYWQQWPATDPRIGHQKGYPTADGFWQDDCNDYAYDWQTCYGPYEDLNPGKYLFMWEFEFSIQCPPLVVHHSGGRNGTERDETHENDVVIHLDVVAKQATGRLYTIARDFLRWRDVCPNFYHQPGVGSGFELTLSEFASKVEVRIASCSPHGIFLKCRNLFIVQTG